VNIGEEVEGFEVVYCGNEKSLLGGGFY